MKRMEKNFSQLERFIVLIIHLMFLFIINYLAFGVWIPSTSPKGLWFYSGAAALIFGNLLFTPYFVKPVDAISYLVSAIIAILAFEPLKTNIIYTIPHDILICFFFIIMIFAIWNVIFKDSKNRWFHNTAELGRIIADKVGNPRFIYSLILFYALWEYHFDNPLELFYISIAGIVISAQQPLETIGNLIFRVKNIWQPKPDINIIGTVAAFQDPNIILIRLDTPQIVKPGACVLISDQHTIFKVCVILSFFGRDDKLLIRTFQLRIPQTYHSRLNTLIKHMSFGSVLMLSDDETKFFREEISLLKNYNSFVGIVAPDTSLERLYFEVTQEKELEQGRLVETNVGDRQVIYQILDGLTKEEIIQQKNTYGYARCEAIQVGEWDSLSLKFKPSNWIPRLNTPVILQSITERIDNENAVGYFPLTSYDVEIKNIDELVTHNTAILGILGVGKSMLAIELVERMINHGIKVVCIDLTDQYANELSDFYDREDEEKGLEIIQNAGQQDINVIQNNPTEGGSISNLQNAIYDDLKIFLEEKNTKKIKDL